MSTWGCKIGELVNTDLPDGADYPMRRAVERAYREITGKEPQFLFSGWNTPLTEDERAVVHEQDRNLAANARAVGEARPS